MALTTVNVGYQHRKFVDSTCASKHVNAQLGRCDGREDPPNHQIYLIALVHGEVSLYIHTIGWGRDYLADCMSFTSELFMGADKCHNSWSQFIHSPLATPVL